MIQKEPPGRNCPPELPAFYFYSDLDPTFNLMQIRASASTNYLDKGGSGSAKTLLLMRKIFFLKKVQFEKSRPAFHLYSRLAIC
jgi:hypothetical protein